MDAAVLAAFTRAMPPQARPLKNADARALDELVQRRRQLIDIQVQETLFGSLKVERLRRQRFVTRRHAKDETLAWLL
jgi:hypothetical protein